MDFDEDIRQHILAQFPHEPSQEQELAAMEAPDLLIIFRNWLSRFVWPQPRKVHCSAALTANPLSRHTTYGPALEQIVSKLGKGEQVTPHLSRGVKRAYQSSVGKKPIPLPARGDLDLMLNAWGVHHLHLSTSLEEDGFVTRTEALLFAVFKVHDAYLIDIMRHGDWTRDHVLEVIIKEWTEAGIVHEMKGVLGLAQSLSETDRKLLRENAINSPFEFQGKFYYPAHGLTTAGTSVTVTREVNRLVHDIKEFRRRLEEDPKYVSKAIAQKGLTVPAQPDLHFVFLNNGYGIVERQTRALFQLR